MSKIKIDTSDVGWVITKDHLTGDADENNLPPDTGTTRVGYGQMLAEAEDTQESFDRVIGRQIFVHRNLKVEDIPSDKRVKWRSFSDDGDPGYDGVVNVDWLYGREEGAHAEDYAYNIDRFNMDDIGAVIVVYNAADIKRCRPDLSDYVDRHPRMTHKEWLRTAGIDPKAWLPIYG